MRQSLLLLIALISCTFTYAQTPAIDVIIHARVDTTNAEIKEVANLWVNYLSSRPDSICDNPYWNEEEKKKYEDFDFSRTSMFQMYKTSKQLFYVYKPTILSIEKEGDNYAIRTLFNSDMVEGMYRKYNPWCITKLYAVRENEQWRLKNARPVITQDWNRKTIGKITFIYSPSHTFDEALAQKSNRFCDSVAAKFEFTDWKPFDFYITASADEMGQLLNFDYFYAGYTTGKGLNDQRVLLSGLNSEWYSHEFIHLIVENKKRHLIVEEGFARWVGGSQNKPFEEFAEILAENLTKDDTVTFNHILSKKWGWQFTAYYTTGSIICKMVYEKGGLAALKTLLNLPEGDDDALIKTLCELLKIEPDELDKVLREETLKYLKE